MTLGSSLIGPKEANDSAWLGGVRKKKLLEPHMVDAWWVLGLEVYLKELSVHRNLGLSWCQLEYRD